MMSPTYTKDAATAIKEIVERESTISLTMAFARGMSLQKQFLRSQASQLSCTPQHPTNTQQRQRDQGIRL